MTFLEPDREILVFTLTSFSQFYLRIAEQHAHRFLADRTD
jgi:hypothetical protein